MAHVVEGKKRKKLPICPKCKHPDSKKMHFHESCFFCILKKLSIDMLEPPKKKGRD